MCVVVGLLCDVLFFTVISNLAVPMTCFNGEVVIPMTEVVCWSSTHRAALTASLTAFGFFIPLSIMVAPVLAEANKNTSAGAVSISKPYVMIVNVLKVVVVMVIVFASSLPLPSIIAASGLALLLALVSARWSVHGNWKLPASAPSVNSAKIFTSVGALLCSFVALAAYVNLSLRTPWRYLVVLGIALVFDIALPAGTASHITRLAQR